MCYPYPRQWTQQTVHALLGAKRGLTVVCRRCSYTSLPRPLGWLCSSLYTAQGCGLAHSSLCKIQDQICWSIFGLLAESLHRGKSSRLKFSALRGAGPGKTLVFPVGIQHSAHCTCQIRAC